MRHIMAKMKYVLKFVALLVIFETISCSEENDRVILSQMQDWGKEIFKTLTGKTKSHDYGQYLVAALLSDDDLNTPHKMPGRLLKGCPHEGPDHDKQMIMCSTSAVFLDRKSKEIWENSPWKNVEKCKKHNWHGEYILLREGFIEKLAANFGTGKTCHLYLYSLFIPCADIQGCPYSCSQIIDDYNKRGNIKCRITVIGYTRVYGMSKELRTNEEKAVENINSSGAILYKNIKDLKLPAIEHVKQINLPFQELLFSCIVESHLSRCCLNKPGIPSSSKEEIIAYYVNNMAFTAIAKIRYNNLEKRYKKYLTEFNKWIENSISRECNYCPFEYFHKLVLKFCTGASMQLAKGFGNPTTARDLSHASWTFNGNSWKSIYRVTPQEFRNTKMLLCAKRPFTVDSLCTKYEIRGQDDSDSDTVSMRLDMDIFDSDKDSLERDMDISDSDTVPMELDRND
ncbi:uncharacterized protein LOC132747130 [Ruditapes philippinarum]|uniref:uncharacterized protein LOC132747130 n=1 Tax=Ruditapes philippinarum TaxID=129788 RepID=UPI00295AB9AB|nr:uncharacterized protein LOC132747130 [Ruditapes philippinarum]